MKLFMFYVGGNFRNSNIELHDLRFSVGATPEDCFADLQRQWWGDPESLHLDCYGAIEQADGHDVTLGSEAPKGNAPRLFFVNLGGYDPAEFAELHRNVLIVAKDAAAAKARALSTIQGWSLPHKDNLFEIEKAVDVSATMAQSGHHLHLVPATEERPFTFTCTYLPIGKEPATAR